MDSKIDIAVDLLSRIGMQRIGVANSERSIIPAALRLGLSEERVAHLAGTTVEHVAEIRAEFEHGEG